MDMTSEPQDHWTKVYEEKSPSAVSWFQPEPAPSLHALDRLDTDPSSPFIDVGGGASNLVDALLDRGWQDITVLDIAASALEAAKRRLGEKGNVVHWEVADVTDWKPTRQYGVWHDRAVFHFLTAPEQRKAYRQTLEAGVAPNGLVIMATFALDGPEKCSGLPVQRYDSATLSAELGDNFRMVEAWREEHSTPWNATQSFNWCAFRRSV